VALVIIILGGLGIWLFLAGLYGVTPADLLKTGQGSRSGGTW